MKMAEKCAECGEMFEPVYRVPDFLKGSMICPRCEKSEGLDELRTFFIGKNPQPKQDGE